MISRDLLWALYEVLLKRLLPDLNPRELACFVGWRGVWNVTVLFPVAAALWWCGIERVDALPAGKLVYISNLHAPRETAAHPRGAPVGWTLVV